MKAVRSASVRVTEAFSAGLEVFFRRADSIYSTPSLTSDRPKFVSTVTENTYKLSTKTLGEPSNFNKEWDILISCTQSSEHCRELRSSASRGDLAYLAWPLSACVQTALRKTDGNRVLRGTLIQALRVRIRRVCNRDQPSVPVHL